MKLTRRQMMTYHSDPAGEMIRDLRVMETPQEMWAWIDDKPKGILENGPLTEEEIQLWRASR